MAASLGIVIAAATLTCPHSRAATPDRLSRHPSTTSSPPDATQAVTGCCVKQRPHGGDDTAGRQPVSASGYPVAETMYLRHVRRL